MFVLCIAAEELLPLYTVEGNAFIGGGLIRVSKENIFKILRLTNF